MFFVTPALSVTVATDASSAGVAISTGCTLPVFVSTVYHTPSGERAIVFYFVNGPAGRWGQYRHNPNDGTSLASVAANASGLDAVLDLGFRRTRAIPSHSMFCSQETQIENHKSHAVADRSAVTLSRYS